MAENVRFTVLSVPVVIRSSERSILERCAVCYGALPGHEADEADCLKVSAEPTHDGWSVRAADREPVHAPDFIAAVRTLNHELMHGVMLRNLHLFHVHAGVVAVDDKAVVLPGLSGAGKSTLVLAMLQAGARLLSDELMSYDPVANALLPFPRAVKVRDVCVDYFPELRDRFVGTGEGRFLPFDALPSTDIAASAAPCLVAAPRWRAGGTGAEPRLEPQSRGQGLLHLVESALNFGSQKTRGIDCLAKFVDGCDCYTLIWSDPHAAAESLLAAVARTGGRE